MRAVIWQNVASALGLKALVLVTTFLGLTGLWLAVLADTGATVLVTANSLRLLRPVREPKLERVIRIPSDSRTVGTPPPVRLPSHAEQRG